jgi:hypothetical protein
MGLFLQRFTTMFQCSFPGCKFESTTAQGVGLHQRYHVDAGEAEYASNAPGMKTLRKLDTPVTPNAHPNQKRKYTKRQGEMNCPLGCGYTAPNGVGLASHLRGHVARGEAEIKDGKHVATGKAFEITAKMKMLAKRRQETAIVRVESQPDGFDISKLTQADLDSIRQQLGTQPMTATDRLKDATVLTTVAEMLNDVPADQMLFMLSQMRNMPRR